MYVHCKAGRGRSTTLVLCYLVSYGGYTPEDALEMVKGKRPQISLAAGQVNWLGRGMRTNISLVPMHVIWLTGLSLLMLALAVAGSCGLPSTHEKQELGSKIHR